MVFLDSFTFNKNYLSDEENVFYTQTISCILAEKIFGDVLFFTF